MAQALNKTQKTILNLYIRGATRKEIATHLGMSLDVVNHSVASMRDRLGIEDRGIDIGQWMVSRIPRDVLVKYI